MAARVAYKTIREANQTAGFLLRRVFCRKQRKWLVGTVPAEARLGPEDGLRVDSLALAVPSGLYG